VGVQDFPFIVRLLAAATVTDNRIALTKRASAQQDLPAVARPVVFDVVRLGSKWDKNSRVVQGLCSRLKDRKDRLLLCRDFPVSPPPAAADNGPYVDFDGCPTTSAPFYIRTASQDTTSWRTPALLQHAFVLSRRYAAIAHFQGHPGGGPSHSSTKGTVWFAPAKGAPTSAG